ncbi:hypothetical protein DRO54_01050 [Candidatus Bathyarchaeota archaeon]|nr:MAG: hypothetical protein DRO54_01050 [Candidatus Bathyarchaeota archaeon]
MNAEEILGEKAASLFLEGYLCSESVLLTFSEYQGIKSELIPRIATAFGAGFGRKGLICGCVTAALMVIGLERGRDTNLQDKEKAFILARKFCEKFEERFGSLFCFELTGCDLLAEKGRKEYAEKKIKEKKCVNFVKETISLLMKLIET